MSFPKQTILSLLLTLSCFVLSAQGRLQYVSGQFSVIQLPDRHQFWFVYGSNNSDSFTFHRSVSTNAAKGKDTVFWKLCNGKTLLVAVCQSGSKKSVPVTLYYFDPLYPQHNLTGQVKLPKGSRPDHIDERGLYVSSPNGWSLVQFKPGTSTAESQPLAVITPNYADSSVLLPDLSRPIFNPFGPYGRQLQRAFDEYHADSLLSPALAEFKRNLLMQPGTMFWDLQSARMQTYRDTGLADAFNGTRELHMVELYVEERFFNEGKVRALISSVYPGLFSGKWVLTDPFFRRGGICGFRFTWFTMSMLQLKIKPSMVPGAAAILVVRKSLNDRMSGNYLYPETLFLQDEVFTDIYSKPNPEERAKTLLGRNCIDSSRACNPEWMMLAAKDWFIRGQCNIDSIIPFGPADTLLSGSAIARYKTFAAVVIQEGTPGTLEVRLPGSDKWNHNQFYGMYDFPANMIWNVSATFARENQHYDYRIHQKGPGRKGWLLLVSQKE